MVKLISSSRMVKDLSYFARWKEGPQRWGRRHGLCLMGDSTVSAAHLLFFLLIGTGLLEVRMWVGPAGKGALDDDACRTKRTGETRFLGLSGLIIGNRSDFGQGGKVRRKGQRKEMYLCMI